MKHITTLLLALFASNLFSEELSSMSLEDVGNLPDSALQVSIPFLVRNSDVAGFGEFVNTPSPTNPVVDIHVQQWWTPNLGTNNMLRIHGIDETETNWIFPTNAPVVFFANAASNVIINTSVDEDAVARMSQDENWQWVFKHVDRSWFRVSRDNGLMYDFTTNLWRHVRVSPNLTNEYTFLRDTFNSAYNIYLSEQPLPSWRVACDSSEGLDYIFENATESFIAKILVDPLLPEDMQNLVHKELEKRFAWYEDTNGVFRAQDTATLIALSNFTAQAIAVWRTHDTNSIILFAKNAVATNAIAEALMFRGTVAYYLENDLDTAMSLISSADRMMRENRAYTSAQKTTFSRVSLFFWYVQHNPEYVKDICYIKYISGVPLEDFWKEHSSKGSIFEKFDGEYPFSYTLESMCNRKLYAQQPLAEWQRK